MVVGGLLFALEAEDCWRAIGCCRSRGSSEDGYCADDIDEITDQYMDVLNVSMVEDLVESLDRCY